MQVDAHAHDRVDQAESVRAGILAGFRDLRDVGDIGRELEDDRFLCHFAHCRGDLGCRLRIGAVGHAAAVDIRAGDIDFEPADLFFGGHFFGDFNIFVYGESADIGHDRFVEYFFKQGEFLGDHSVDARVFKSGRVQNAVVIFGDAGLRIAETRLAGRSLEGERAKTVDIVVIGKLIAVPEDSARRNDRIVDRDTAQIDFQVDHRNSLPDNFFSRQNGSFLADALDSVFGLDAAAAARTETASHTPGK